MVRDRWPSRTLFVYAAIGSAVGLGNIWRYPYLAEKFGGGAFLIPYLIALFVAGIPLLILEFGLGQKMQKGAVDSFAAIKKKLSGLGWWALFTAFIVISYYVVVMAWSLIYMLVSVGVQWSEDPKTYFFGNVLQLSDSINSIGHIVPAVFIALAISWIWIYFSIWKGVKSVSKVVVWAVPLPFILMIALLIRVITLDGAAAGIAAYLTPNFSALLDAEVWSAAFAQVFFSLSLAFMASQQNVPLDDVIASGPGLAFVAFPQALSLMPFATFFSILFFITLLTLAIDSAFSLVEAINATVLDKRSE